IPTRRRRRGIRRLIAYALVFAKIAQDEIDKESAPRPVQIPTIAYFKPPTLFHTDELFSVRQSGRKAVLSAAKFLLGVSSSLDGEPLRRCSGFWVDWDEESRTGLVLTTARLIRTKDAPVSVWSGSEEYELLQYDNGGPVIDLDGKVVGMVNDPERFESFIPSSILLNCLDSWRKYRHFAWPQLGMTFKAIELLEPAHADMLWHMFNIDDGLVVQEVG
uniref:Uncharacterized protein n=1 Tax=Triticum urartu TaxID=4572 RepID=A0A8R7Q7Q5_TRIUA